MLCQAAMLIIFFIPAVPKDSQRFPKRCGEPRIYFAISLRSVNSTACGSMVNENKSHRFIFLESPFLSYIILTEYPDIHTAAAAASP